MPSQQCPECGRVIEGPSDPILAENLREHELRHQVLKDIKKIGEAYDFEERVSNAFLALGAEVERNVALAGIEIDLLVTERMESRHPIKSGVECKSYPKPVGIEVVRGLSAVNSFLRERGLVDRVALVSREGFTPGARELAKLHAIELFSILELEAQAKRKGADVLRSEEQLEVDERVAIKQLGQAPEQIFVVMPFAKTFDDVFVIGIREVADKLGMAAERADDIEHNRGILDVVREKIKGCDIVVADATGQNANVFYEIGYAHGHGKSESTILIAEKGQKIPFDLQGMNCIFYEGLIELRDKLAKRLIATRKL